jgi:hypothetical protein
MEYIQVSNRHVLANAINLARHIPPNLNTSFGKNIVLREAVSAPGGASTSCNNGSTMLAVLSNAQYPRLSESWMTLETLVESLALGLDYTLRTCCFSSLLSWRNWRGWGALMHQPHPGCSVHRVPPSAWGRWGPLCVSTVTTASCHVRHWLGAYVTGPWWHPRRKSWTCSCLQRRVKNNVITGL